MIETTNNQELLFTFPQVHERASLSLAFMRTLRIPDDNRRYPLPAGLGNFPLHHVDDFADKVPPAWRPRGGIFLPMYQSEALWLSFSASQYPCAIKIAAGKINAVTGEPWSEQLSDSPQDYVVAPGQPWLDGFAIGVGLIRQFVAMPLGQGFSAEEQITGKAEHGGLQIFVFPMKPERFAKLQRRQRVLFSTIAGDWDSGSFPCEVNDEMGLAPGGLMRQTIYADEHGVDAWDQSAGSRCFVHIVNSGSYRKITGCRPPTEPPTASQYQASGIPWFDYYNADAKALEGAKVLANLDSVATRRIKLGQHIDEPAINVSDHAVRKLGPGVVRSGKF